VAEKKEMVAKEYLRQTIELKKNIESKQNQIMELQAMAERTTSSYEALRVSGTASHRKLEDAVVRLSAVGDELAGVMAMFTEKYGEISAVIDAIENPTYRELLTLRYLCFMSWEEVAEKMHYSDRWVRGKLHDCALNSVSVPCSSG